MNEPIVNTRTGGFTLLSILLVIAGSFLLVLQIVTLVQGTSPDAALWTQFLPGLLALPFLALFFLGIRNGSLTIYADRVEGKTAGGKKYKVSFDEIELPDPSGRAFVLRSNEGKVLVADKTPQYRKALGLVWMLKSYGEMNAAGWPFFDIKQSAPQTRPIRFFDDGESASFGDRGFLFKFQDSIYYFPVSQTSILPRERGEAGPGPTLAVSQTTVPQFEPHPGYLPLESVWQAVLTSDWEEGEKKALLDLWLERHGACVLTEAPADIDAEFIGEVGDYQVRVSRPGK